MGSKFFPRIVVYQRWCSACRSGVPLLDLLGIPYEEVDLEHDPAAAQLVLEVNGGRWLTPVYEIDGRYYVQPSAEEILAILGMALYGS